MGNSQAAPMLEIEGDVDLSQLKGTMGEPFEFTLNLKNTSEKAVSDLSLTFTDGSSLFDKAYPIPAIAPSASFPIVLKAELPKFFVGELKPVYTLLNKKKKPVNIKKSDGSLSPVLTMVVHVGEGADFRKPKE